MYGLFRTEAGTWHVIRVPDSEVALITYATTPEEAIKQLDSYTKQEGVDRC